MRELKRPWRDGAFAGALWSGAFYLLLAVIYTFPLIRQLDSGVLRGVDTEDALQQTWVLGWVQHALLTNPAGLFNAPIFYPTQGTLAYHDNLIPLAVAMLPISGLVHNPLAVYNLAVLLAYPLSGVAMYALAWHLCHDRRAAFLAGVIFAFCPYRERHIEHLNLLSAEGIPLVILGFEAARTKGGAWHWGFLGLALALCATLSLYYTAFVCLALVLYLMVLILGRRTLVPRTAWRGVWALALTLPFAGAALLPYIRAQHAVGGERRLQDLVYFSADVRDFLHAGPQSLLYGWSDGLWHIAPLDVRQYLFPGWTAMTLALGGVLWTRRQKIKAGVPARSRHAGDHGARDGDRRAAYDDSGSGSRRESRSGAIYLAMAGLLALLALGPYLRLFGFFTRIPLPYISIYLFAPGFQGFRDVGRYDQVAMAFLAGAAAIGAARLFAHTGRRRALWLLAAVTALLVLEYWTVQRPLYPVASGSRVPSVYTWLAGQPAGVVAELPMCGLPGPPCLEESSYMYFSTYHWHPLINGGGGFFPPQWNSEVAAINQFPAPNALAALAALQVRYVVVHANYPGLAAICRALSDTQSVPQANTSGHANCLSLPDISPAPSQARQRPGWLKAGAGGAAVYRFGSDLVFAVQGADDGHQ